MSPSVTRPFTEVPTWKYAVVHAYAPLKVIEDAQWLLDHVSSLTNIHEATFPTPWKVSDAPHNYSKSLLHGIIGLELSIRRLEGKWKVSQNVCPKVSVASVQRTAVMMAECLIITEYLRMEIQQWRSVCL